MQQEGYLTFRASSEDNLAMVKKIEAILGPQRVWPLSITVRMAEEKEINGSEEDRALKSPSLSPVEGKKKKKFRSVREVLTSTPKEE